MLYYLKQFLQDLVGLVFAVQTLLLRYLLFGPESFSRIDLAGRTQEP